jgi:AraC-like DNA-binding protein
VLPDTGRLELETSAGARRVDGRHGALIPAGEDHAFCTRGENRFVVVDFPADCTAPAIDKAVAEPAFELTPLLADTLATFVRHRAGAALSDAARAAWASVLLDALNEPVAGDRDARRFAAATAFIRAHLGRRLDRRAVAAAVDLDAEALGRLFRRRAGCGVTAWIASARLQAAADLLVQTDRPVTTIALDCGFSEHSALTRAFRRRYDMAPRDWRRRRVK